MNYQRVYNAIVDNAKLRQTLDGYYELHHIIPRSLGGDDSQENIVKVTAREHFILHYLLCKIYKEQDQFNKMLYAFMLMKGSNSYQLRYFNSKLYEKAKIKFAQLQRTRFLGVSKTDKHRFNISKGLTGKVTSYETKKKQSESASKRPRKPFSEEYKQKMSEKMKQIHKNKRASVAEMD